MVILIRSQSVAPVGSTAAVVAVGACTSATNVNVHPPAEHRTLVRPYWDGLSTMRSLPLPSTVAEENKVFESSWHTNVELEPEMLVTNRSCTNMFDPCDAGITSGEMAVRQELPVQGHTFTTGGTTGVTTGGTTTGGGITTGGTPVGVQVWIHANRVSDQIGQPLNTGLHTHA